MKIVIYRLVVVFFGVVALVGDLVASTCAFVIVRVEEWAFDEKSEAETSFASTWTIARAVVGAMIGTNCESADDKRGDRDGH